ncbi:RNA (C5-cytosine) methyltransferase [Ostreococcus tauri]|uniref:RNA (C5-cytosine) methyltransferase n=1 Tax=Ostreococcus tauri TaxID=70448 RepID=A0A090LZM4_OSTTA|nr:RNA (C5-cytosine) methyltransferase [Ostreococcus tauri]CEF97450.1 RNA (C5-cytosine) methyltransferase [Ostreococcus tauri]|eukprot:XP_003078614.2 RNA (C5-cytosine) methyltransferase [Ostreococcus tauri]
MRAADASTRKRARDDGDARASSPSTRDEDALWNEKFAAYYAEQRVCATTADHAAMMAAFRRPLPLTFRLNASAALVGSTLRRLEGEVLPALGDGRDAAAPKCAEWYPNRLAWQIDLSQGMSLKTSDSVAVRGLHAFLKTATETGALTRQELVSMIPPLFLDVEPGHLVMDMCAAPGSKTSQLLEMLHEASGPSETPRGVVVANDASLQRANLLTHQCKRSNSPALIVTNHQAQLFPILHDAKGKKLRFDRILADVPCSGDGTLRKSPDLWRKWNASSGVDLHTLQLEIATHALRLLDVGGRLVYSTCSLNPLENEAVVAALLKRAGGAVELVDVSKSLPKLKRRPGMKLWKVGDVFGWHNSFEETGTKRQKTIAKTMFWEASYEQFPLERCVRIFPHLDDTGGFFITVFEKKGELPAEMEATPAVDANTTYRMERANAEWNEKKRVAPVMRVHDAEIVKNIKKHFGVKEDKHLDLSSGLMTRQHSDLAGVTPKRLYYLSQGARDVLTALTKNGKNAGLQVVACGVRAFERQIVSNVDCAYRITQEGLGTVLPHLSKQIVRVRASELETILARQQDESTASRSTSRTSSDNVPEEITHEKSIKNINNVSDGCVILVPKAKSQEHEREASALAVACWLGRGARGKSLSVLASKTSGEQLLYQLRDCIARKTVG